MLRHVVMWSLNDPADAEAFATALRSCAHLVPGIREFDVGVRTDGYEADCDVVLVSTFDDEDALTAYLDHPHHRQVAPGLGTMRAVRHCVDYPFELPAPMNAGASPVAATTAASTGTAARAAAPTPDATPTASASTNDIEPAQGDWE